MERELTACVVTVLARSMSGVTTVKAYIYLCTYAYTHSSYLIVDLTADMGVDLQRWMHLTRS